MHKQVSVLQKEIHKLLRSFKIEKDHPNLKRRANQVWSNTKKRIRLFVDFQAEHRVEIKDLFRELEKLLNMKVTVISVVVRELGTAKKKKKLEKRLGKLEIKERSEIMQATALLKLAKWKNHGDLIRPAVAQTPVKKKLEELVLNIHKD